jgi:hypothetical protein
MWEPRRLTTLWAFTACTGIALHFSRIYPYENIKENKKLLSEIDITLRFYFACGSIWL